MRFFFFFEMISLIKERPPLMVFLLCLICTSLTLLYFSFYIKNTDSVPDSDTIYDWNHLLKYLGKLNICISDHNENVINNDLSSKMVTMQTLASIKLLKFQDYSEVQGLLTLDGWQSTCERKTPKPRNLEIQFNLPKVVENNTNVNVCVSIKGPAEYLPTLSEANCALEDNKIQRKVGYLTSIWKVEYTDHFCQKGKNTAIEFLPQIKEIITNTLGNNQKNRIYVHLLWTSFILIFALLAVVIYSVIQSDSKYKYIDKCSSLVHNR